MAPVIHFVEVSAYEPSKSFAHDLYKEYYMRHYFSKENEIAEKHTNIPIFGNYLL